MKIFFFVDNIITTDQIDQVTEYLTSVGGIKNPRVELTNGKILFQAEDNGTAYRIKQDLGRMGFPQKKRLVLESVI